MSTHNLVNNTTYGLGMCDIAALLGNFAEYERFPVPRVYLHSSTIKLKRPAWVYKPMSIRSWFFFLNSHIFKLIVLSSTRNGSESADSSAAYLCEKT